MRFRDDFAFGGTDFADGDGFARQGVGYLDGQVAKAQFGQGRVGVAVATHATIGVGEQAAGIALGEALQAGAAWAGKIGGADSGVSFLPGGG